MIRVHARNLSFLVRSECIPKDVMIQRSTEERGMLWCLDGGEMMGALHWFKWLAHSHLTGLGREKAGVCALFSWAVGINTESAAIQAKLVNASLVFRSRLGQTAKRLKARERERDR